MEITILGSGNGGCAVAFDHSIKGHNVRIFDFEKYVEFMYGKNVKANYFVGADIMIGRINEQPSV